jgi:hypothetical protein
VLEQGADERAEASGTLFVNHTRLTVAVEAVVVGLVEDATLLSVRVSSGGFDGSSHDRGEAVR